MRNYGISALCWVRELDDRTTFATFDPFLSLLNDSVCVWPLHAWRDIGSGLAVVHGPVSVSKLAATVRQLVSET